MVHGLPTLNALLNAASAVFLCLGWAAIRNADRETHRKYMVAALCSSALFLCSYLTYHFMVPGVTKYQGQGILRVIYFTVLLTHTPLAALIVPFCVVAVVFAVRGEFKKHTKITHWLMPVWLYVSLTGVVIYMMLYVFS